MDRRMSQALDHYLTTPPEEPDELSERQFIHRVFRFLEIPLTDAVRKEIDTFLVEFHKEYCEVEFIAKEND